MKLFRQTVNVKHQKHVPAVNFSMLYKRFWNNSFLISFILIKQVQKVNLQINFAPQYTQSNMLGPPGFLFPDAVTLVSQ